MAHRRRRLSPEHLAALQAGRRRWREGQLPHGIEEQATNPRLAAMRAGREAARARRAEIRERRLENLARAREARRRREDPVPTPPPEPPTPPPEPIEVTSVQPEGLRRYQEARRARKEARREAAARGRETRRVREEAHRTYMERPFNERAVEKMADALSELENGLIGAAHEVVRDETGRYSGGLGTSFFVNLDYSEEVASILMREGGYQLIDQTRDRLYGMLASTMTNMLAELHGLSLANNTNLILVAKRLGSDRWAKVTPAFIRGCRSASFDEHSPYTRRMDWTLNGSKTELLNESMRYTPFPAPIVFMIKAVQPRSPGQTRRPRQGSWAPWKNAFSELDLTRYQVDNADENVLSDEDAREHCLIYALRQTGRVDDTLLNHISAELYGHSTTLRSVRELAERFSLPLKITFYAPTHEHHRLFGPGGQEYIRLGLFDDHYFIEEPVSVSNWVLEHTEEAGEVGPLHNIGWAYKRAEGSEDYIRDPYPIKRSGGLLRRMKELGLLVPIRGDDPHALTRTYYSPKILNEDDLSYCPQFCQPIAPKERHHDSFLWFADFETTTDGDRHLPYMLCALSESGTAYETSDYTTNATNVDSIWSQKLLSFGNFIARHTPRDYSPIVYFHNLNYDMAFILPFVPLEQNSSVVEVNNRIIAFKWFCPTSRQTIHFRDSYAMISAPLRDFGKMFGLTVEKEIFPYSFYTTENFDKYGQLGEPLPHLDVYLSYYDAPEELEMKLRHLGMLGADDRVYAHGYAQYYCSMDCRVLRDGFLRFREQLQTVTTLDCVQYLTLPSTAYNFLIVQGVFEGCFNLAGSPLFFIRKCVLGGRCMLQRNEKRDVTGDIADFDAVSLYPSAMARIYTLKGLPKIIESTQRNLEFLRTTDGFFAQVSIRRVGKALDFPLIAKTNDRGVMEYTNEPCVIYTDDISLENILRSHRVDDVDVEILNGYYYDSGRNYRIREVITHLFEQRLKLKAEGNPLEQAYKLLMNSCYGKSIMKPITTDNYIVPSENFLNNLLTSCCEIITYQEIGSRYLVTKSKNIVSALGFPSFGVHVLAMSKVIMSEVMTLAQDMGIDIYYTDTDSVHLNSCEIPRLAEQYRALYGRELIGKRMGQFHTDFPNHPETRNPTTSRRFIGVGKKAYVDELVDQLTGAIAYHTRLKGIPSTTITKAAEKDYGGNVMALYEDLYAGKSVTFDLLDGRVSFALNNDLTYVTRKDFTRTVQFTQ